MSTVKPEPLVLEVALAHYVASLPEGKSVALEELAGELGCSYCPVIGVGIEGCPTEVPEP